MNRYCPRPNFPPHENHARAGIGSSLLILLAVAMSAGVVGADSAASGLLFHVSFDKHDVSADFAKGRPDSTTFKQSLELRGVAGISGPGMELATVERLDYEMKGNFHPQCGTVLMWVQPVNWRGNNLHFEMFFVARSASPFNFMIYKYQQPGFLTFYIALGQRSILARTTIEDWQPGRWHQIAATWDQQTMRLYLDSELAGETALPTDFVLPARDDGWISIAPPQLWKEGFDPDDRTVVDEVKIYDRVLTAAEVRRAYLQHRPTDKAAPPLDMQTEIDSAMNLVRVHLDAYRLLGKPGANLTASASLAAADGKMIASRSTPMKDGIATIELPYKELTPGKYVVRSEVTGANGRGKATASHEFERPATPWLAPQPQYDHVVPSPWTPVDGDAHQVKVWGRQYRFANGPLPEAVVSQDQSLLRGAATIAVDTGTGTHPIEWKPAAVTARFPDLITRESSGTAGDLQATFRSTVEFDGMLRCDLTLHPQNARATIRRLQLTIPLASEHAGYVLTPYLEPWSADGVKLDFHNLIWITGHHVGLCWFAESDANWVYASGVRPISIVKANGITTLTITMIAKPAEISGPLRYTFGLQASPLRPLPPNWRNLNLDGYGKIRGATAQTICWGGGSLKQEAWLEPSTPAAMNDAIKRFGAMGMKVLPYSTPTHLADDNAVFDFYRLEWENSDGGKFVGFKNKEHPNYSLVATCPRSGFAKRMEYWVENLTRDYKIGGIYFDLCAPIPCTNTRHGCGGVDAFGRRIATAPIFALRELLKRVFIILHSHGMILINHAHSEFYPPCHAFSDYWFPGEQYTAALGRDVWFYTDKLAPEAWQIEMNAHTKGVGIAFLPEYGRGTAEKYREEAKPSRSLLACCVVNDIPVSASWINLNELQQVWDVYDRFHLSAAKFLPYWEPGPIHVDTPLLASGYLQDRSLVVMVSNLTPHPVRGTLRLDTKALGISGACTMRLEPEQQPVRTTPAAIPIDLPERDFTMLAVTW